jgi:hypothetical protein
LFFTKVELGPEEAPGEIEIIFSVFPEIEKKLKLFLYIFEKEIKVNYFSKNRLPDLAVNLLEAKTSKFLPIFLE